MSAVFNPSQSIVVSWIDEAELQGLAAAKGWTEGESLLDFVESSDAEKSKNGFSSVTKAKAWAARNRRLDLWSQPEIAVYAWPDVYRRSHDRETVRRLRYVGDGLGWEELDADGWTR